MDDDVAAAPEPADELLLQVRAARFEGVVLAVAIAVGALGDEMVRTLNRLRVPEDGHVLATQVAAKDQATFLAERLHNPNILEYLPFIEGHSIVEISPPEHFIGKSLKELDLINRFGVQVLAIKERGSDSLNLIPTALFVLKDSHVIILLGPDKSLERLQKANSV